MGGNYEADCKWRPVTRPIRPFRFFVSFLALNAVRNW